MEEKKWRCTQCGADWSDEKKKTCGHRISFLRCSKDKEHKVAKTARSGWKVGDPCTEQKQSGCKGVYKDKGDKGLCPGRRNWC